jgi:hypothetical protein
MRGTHFEFLNLQNEDTKTLRNVGNYLADYVAVAS